MSDGPVLLLRTSEQEYATIQEVLAFVPRMDRAIVGYAQPAIDRLAARLPRPFFPAAGKELTLVRGDLACLCSIFAAVWKPPLSERRDIRECLEKLVDLSEQSSRFVDREWMAPRRIIAARNKPRSVTAVQSLRRHDDATFPSS